MLRKWFEIQISCARLREFAGSGESGPDGFQESRAAVASAARQAVALGVALVLSGWDESLPLLKEDALRTAHTTARSGNILAGFRLPLPNRLRLFKIRRMPGTQAPPPLPKSQPSFGRRHSTIIKLLGVGALVLVLLIPLGMITGVLKERLQRRNEAVADITSSWGREQNLIGPVLGIPYQYKFKTVKEVPAPDGKMERREVEETATGNAYFLPETLNVSGNAETQMLHRGIYDAVVYRAQTTLSGKFVRPDFGPLKIDVKDVQWKDAFVTIAINDLRGTRAAILLDWGRHQTPDATRFAASGLHHRRNGTAGQRPSNCSRHSVFDSAGF